MKSGAPRRGFFLGGAVLALIALGAGVGLNAARAEQLVTDLSEHQVAVQSNFTGTEILLFGVVETSATDRPAGSGETTVNPRDIIVVVTGPARPTTVRRKERVGGVWLNYQSVSFASAPGYYAVASTRPLDVITDEGTRTIERIGAEHLDFGAFQAHDLTGQDIDIDPAVRDRFAAALIDGKKKQGLYRYDPGGVTFLGSSLFRVTLDIPANVPVGLYAAKVFLVRGGVIVDVLSSPIYIEKSGIERAIYRLAVSQPLLYGLIAVVLAALAGWLASVVFRTA